jgi:hypothetical protein
MPATFHLTLPHGASFASTAHCRTPLRRRGQPATHGDVAPVFSELVNTAVRHGRGDIVVKLQLDGDVLRGPVIDDGGGSEHPVRARGPQDLSGRGLAIVEALTSRGASARARPTSGSRCPSSPPCPADRGYVARIGRDEDALPSRPWSARSLDVARLLRDHHWGTRCARRDGIRAITACRGRPRSGRRVPAVLAVNGDQHTLMLGLAAAHQCAGAAHLTCVNRNPLTWPAARCRVEKFASPWPRRATLFRL